MAVSREQRMALGGEARADETRRPDAVNQACQQMVRLRPGSCAFVRVGPGRATGCARCPSEGHARVDQSSYLRGVA